jgi:hypothetical protein
MAARPTDTRPGRAPAPPAVDLTLGGAALTLDRFLLADGTGPARQQTAVRLHATRSALTAAFECHDTDPWGSLTRRDDPLYSEECVEVFLAPGGLDPVDYFEFEVNPLGALFDARIHNPTGRRESLVANIQWNAPGAVWEAARAPEAGYWRASLTLPWADLGFPDPAALPPTWRVNFYRIDRPRDGAPAEFSCWSPTLESPANFHVPARFGTLRLV